MRGLAFGSRPWDDLVNECPDGSEAGRRKHNTFMYDAGSCVQPWPTFQHVGPQEVACPEVRRQRLCFDLPGGLYVP